MPAIFKALFVHGVGEQAPDFADEAIENLRGACRARGLSIHPEILHWAPLADRPEQAFLARAESLGSKANMTQRLVVGTLADALMYCTSPKLKEQIFAMLDERWWMLGSEGTIFAHSLGGLIVTDWLRQRPDITNVRLVTLGCNIGLFNLGCSFKRVPALERPGRWLNVFSPRDFLGFALATDPALRHVSDRAVGVGGWFTGWTGLAHVRYWGDSKIWKKTLPEMLHL
jgi:pimeloyl-ACP methyl ester carboxylesterase